MFGRAAITALAHILVERIIGGANLHVQTFGIGGKSIIVTVRRKMNELSTALHIIGYRMPSAYFVCTDR